jgi:hypothetical protein
MYHADAKRNKFDQSKFKHSCGTPSCSLGNWAARNRDRWEWYGHLPVLKGFFDSWESAAEDFEINYIHVKNLFAMNGCGNAKTARQASIYIKEFVRRHTPPRS